MDRGSKKWLFAEVFAIWSVAVPLGLQVLASFRMLLAVATGVPQQGLGYKPPPTAASMAALVLHRLIFYMLPLWRFGLLWGTVWAAYPAMIFSLLFMLNTQLAHLNHETEGESPEPRADCWYLHQLATTVDFAQGSAMHWLVSGGLNLQVMHHLFPTVDHCHLPELCLIVKRVCDAHGVQLHSWAGYVDGMWSHLRLLKQGVTGKSPALKGHTSGALAVGKPLRSEATAPVSFAANGGQGAGPAGSALGLNGKGVAITNGCNAGLLQERFYRVLARPKSLLMHLAVGWSQQLLDRGMLPDWAIRFGIRLKLALKIRKE